MITQNEETELLFTSLCLCVLEKEFIWAGFNFSTDGSPDVRLRTVHGPGCTMDSFKRNVSADNGDCSYGVYSQLGYMVYHKNTYTTFGGVAMSDKVPF